MIQNKVQRVNDLILDATLFRGRLNKIAEEFVAAHGDPPESNAGRLLSAVILEGRDYETTMLEIQNAKLAELAAEGDEDGFFG